MLHTGECAGVCSYLTTTEWSSFYGGKKTTVEVGEKSKFRRMPFFCCRWWFPSYFEKNILFILNWIYVLSCVR